MINEAYLRSVLLGGMHPTTVLTRSRAFREVTISEERLGVLSLPELERLQQTPISSQRMEAELAHEIWYRNLNSHSLSRGNETSDTIFLSIVNDALIRVSQGAQWDSLRTDILSRLENIYLFRDEAKVRVFLEKNAFLAPLLLQANSKIRDYFTASLPIALDVSIDPENGEYKELWARILTSLPPADALTLLTRFDEEWWLQASVASRNLLNIKLEYV